MKYKQELYLYLFAISVVLASLAVNLFILKGYNHLRIDLLLEGMKGVSTRGAGDIFSYIVIKRLKQLFLVYVLLKTFKPEIILSVMSVLFGVFWGMMISNQVYQNGFMGAILLVLCFIPHFPVYILVIKNITSTIQNKYRDKYLIMSILTIMFIFAIGIVCECYFSRIFLKEFYQHMVM